MNTSDREFWANLDSPPQKTNSLEKARGYFAFMMVACPLVTLFLTGNVLLALLAFFASFPVGLLLLFVVGALMEFVFRR